MQHSKKISFKPNVIFVDEIQNIEDIHGRGILFEYILEQISIIYPNTKIISAGPFIKNENKLFEDIFNLKPISCKTTLSPVMQLKTIIRNTTSENNIELYINESSSDHELKLTISSTFDLNFEFKKNKGKRWPGKIGQGFKVEKFCGIIV